MVAVAVLAVAIVPMLILREDSYNKAIETKTLRVAQQLAREMLSHIALNVRNEEGSDTFEDWEDYRYEYNVTLYDFNMGLEDDSYYDDRDEEPMFGNQPDDSFFPEDEDELTRESSSMTMRHVELKIIYPKYLPGGEFEECEYIIDTYLPLLMTEKQYEFQMKQQEEEESDWDE